MLALNLGMVFTSDNNDCITYSQTVVTYHRVYCSYSMRLLEEC